jgi:hypothetical protein
VSYPAPSSTTCLLQRDGACRSDLIADPATREAAIVDPIREHVDLYLDLLGAKKLRLRRRSRPTPPRIIFGLGLGAGIK